MKQFTKWIKGQNISRQPEDKPNLFKPFIKKLFFTIIFLFSLNSLAGPMDKAQLLPPLPSNLWVEMSKITQPAVVGIYLEANVNAKNIPRDPFFNLIEELLGRDLGLNRPPKFEEQNKPVGTGFLIDREGHIVTNYHVTQPLNNPQLKVRLKIQIYGKNKLYDVDFLGSDSRGDIALLKLKEPVKDISYLKFGDSDKLEVGEYVAAFGNPYGHSNSMAVGIISAKGRSIEELNRFPFIQTDASINPGNSGGPLMNTQGYVIGVNTAIDARAQGIGFAIPSNYVKRVVNIIKSGGTIQKGFLGVGLANLNRRMALAYGIKKGGTVITQVEPDYPAEKAGLKPNDIIYEFNNQAIHSSESLIYKVQDTEVGKTVSVKVLRPKSDRFVDMTFKVTLTHFPESGQKQKGQVFTRYPGQKAPYSLGFSVVNSSSGARKYYNIPLKSPFAPIVSRLKSGSPAHRAGVKVGFLVMEVNGKAVHSSSEVIKALNRKLNHLKLYTSKGLRQILIKNP